MERHNTDLVALLLGLLFLAVGGGYLAHEVSGRSLDPVWIVAITTTTTGLAFLAATLFHRREPEDETFEGEPSPPADS